MSKLPDFSAVFAKYEALRDGVDSLFKQISADFSDCVNCAEGCSDCCHAMFDLPLIEAMYINSKFTEQFGFGAERSTILEQADKADRQAFKFKRKIFKESQEGRDSNEIMQDAARERVRCPLLGDDHRCRMYEFRPLTCRIYGVPVNIGGTSHSCGKSSFKPGGKYPAVSLEAINNRLMELSKEITDLTNGAYSELHNVFVPLSMALLNKYDEEYLGLKKAKE
ncbi:YkgJ family cysteine cluster protein [Desulfovibrio sp. OttesenSCG-928-F07]|nr:YkgJ family cysteine cluster protein [Desulfovibrio sp. OttesenSCG-928-F07]